MKVDREHIIRELGQRSLKHFIKFTFPDYEFNWHHLEMIDKIDRFVSGDVKKLMVFMPPQHGKSEIVSRRLPAFLLGKNPNLRIASCSYNTTFAKKFNRAVQRIIDTKEFATIFPNVSLSSKRTRNDPNNNFLRNTDEFEIIDHDGSYISVGVLGGLTGNPVDIGIIDDPVKDSIEANSITYRERVWDWYTDVFKTRLHNDSKILLTMTRWHEDDLAGRILENESDWELIVFPAIKDQENADDPRKIGDALWESRHSKERLEDIKNLSVRTWNALYQQRPSAIDGDIINRNWFRNYDQSVISFTKHRSSVELYIDPAYTSKKSNDPTAVLVYFKHNGNLYLVRSYQLFLELPDLIKTIEEKVYYYGNGQQTRVYVEPKASGKSIVQTLKKTNKFLVYEDKPPTESKVARVHAVTPYIESGRVFVPDNADWVDGFIAECVSFPNGKHDDQVDCLSAVIRMRLMTAVSYGGWSTGGMKR